LGREILPSAVTALSVDVQAEASSRHEKAVAAARIKVSPRRPVGSLASRAVVVADIRVVCPAGQVQTVRLDGA
jgi:hypothetical protein